MRDTSKYLICLMNMLRIKHTFGVITCSHIFIMLEYIMKQKCDQKKRTGKREIYQFNIA